MLKANKWIFLLPLLVPTTQKPTFLYFYLYFVIMYVYNMYMILKKINKTHFYFYDNLKYTIETYFFLLFIFGSNGYMLRH